MAKKSKARKSKARKKKRAARRAQPKRRVTRQVPEAATEAPQAVQAAAAQRKAKAARPAAAQRKAAPVRAAQPTTVDFAKEYGYVYSDLKRVGVIAAAMLVILVVLSFIIT